ncbi:phasin family protein [Glaciecola siphonariae]|uniref:Phasin family protein n=1 Tax=Glaciecola siphonariae TaxID=521012 RepID=A0ABV9LWT4_9ALTE
MMFGNLSQQMKKSTQPVSTLLEMNAKTLELVSEQQTVFFSGLMSDSKKLLASLGSQSELNGVLAAQSVYAESVRERFTSASKNTYTAISTMNSQAASVMKSALELAGEDAKQAVSSAMTATKAPVKASTKKTSVAKPTAAKKSVKGSAVKASDTKAQAAKTLEKPAASTSQATESKASTKPVARKASVKKAPAKATTTRKAEAVSAKAVKAEAPNKTTQQQVSKPVIEKTRPQKAVAQLSPADVKADSSKNA